MTQVVLRSLYEICLYCNLYGTSGVHGLQQLTTPYPLFSIPNMRLFLYISSLYPRARAFAAITLTIFELICNVIAINFVTILPNCQAFDNVDNFTSSYHNYT